MKKAPAGKSVGLEDQFDIGTRKRSSEWWDFFKDGINNSGIGLWLADRHQFWLRYVCGYDYSVYQDSIEFGNIFHWLIERWLKGKLKNPEKELRKVYHREWVGTFHGLTPTNKQTQERFYALAAAMWPHYAEKFKDDLKKDWTGIEVEFTAKHTLNIDGRGWPTKVPLYGTIDGVWMDDAGFEHLLDHKTSSWINEQEILAALPLNFQLLFYAYAWKLLKKRTVKTISHDVIRRTTSKPKKNESLQKWAKRMGSEVGGNPDYYFTRITVPITNRKLQRFTELVIEPILLDMADWAAGRLRHYPNVNALIGRYGPCPLFTSITTANFAGVPRKRPTTRGVER